MRSYNEKLKKLTKLKTIHFGRLNFGSIPSYCRFPPAPERQRSARTSSVARLRLRLTEGKNFVNSSQTTKRLNH